MFNTSPCGFLVFNLYDYIKHMRFLHVLLQVRLIPVFSVCMFHLSCFLYVQLGPGWVNELDYLTTHTSLSPITAWFRK